MAENRENHENRQPGFTITEMLVALAILTFGLTALAGSMMVGVGERRGTEMRFRAVNLVDRIFYHVQENHFVAHPRGSDLPNIPASGEDPPAAPGHPSMSYTVVFVEDADNPQVVLARVRISWREQGEAVAEEFERILVRETPFSRRISRLREAR